MNDKKSQKLRGIFFFLQKGKPFSEFLNNLLLKDHSGAMLKIMILVVLPVNVGLSVLLLME